MKALFLFLGFVISSSEIVANPIDYEIWGQENETSKWQERFAFYENQYDKTVGKDRVLAKTYLDSLDVLSNKLGSDLYKAKVLKAQGSYHYYLSEFEISEVRCKEAIALFEALDVLDPIPNVLNQLGISQKYLGKYDEALKNHQKSADLNLEIKGDPIDLARSYLNMGNVMFEARNIKASTDYYLKSEEVCLQYGLDQFIAKAWGNVAANYRYEKQYEKALKYHFKSLELMQKDPSIALTREYNNIGAVYDDMEDYDNAKLYYYKAMDNSQRFGEPQLIGLIHRNLGEMFMVDGNYPEAEKHIQKSIQIAKKIKNKDRLIRGYRKMSEIKAALGDYKNAHDYDWKYFNLKDSIQGVKVKERLNTLEIKYQTEKKEAAIALQQEEIKTLNEKAKVDKLSKGLYAGGMASALALFGLSVFGYRQRIKRNRIAREKQEEIYKQEIEHKQKELASQTLHLVQKNTFIQELKENLENLKNSPEKFKAEFRRIVMLLKKENASDKDWEVFKTYFADVHNDFDQKLKTLYADISEKEIRLAAFLRMNLTTKEIAATLNVLPDSILKSKYRLKKKLGLDKETDLNRFLSTL